MSTDAADDTATPLSDAPDALAELARREGTSGIVEKASRSS